MGFLFAMWTVHSIFLTSDTLTNWCPLAVFLKIRKNYDTAIYHKGNALEDLGLHEEAIEIYKKYLKIIPKSYHVLFDISYLLIKLNRKKDALKAANRAFKYYEPKTKKDTVWKMNALIKMRMYYHAETLYLPA